METFFAFLGALIAVLLLIAVVVWVIFPLLTPGVDAAEGLATRVLGWLTLAFWWLPTALGTAVAGLVAHVREYWKWYLLAVLALTLSFGWMAEQNAALKAYDAYETEVAYPFYREVLLPVANVFRLLYSGSICWVNLLAGLGRYVRWALVVIAGDCPGYSSAATLAAFGKIPVLPVLALRDFVLSGFTSNLDVAPTTNAVADVMTTLDPMFECQCDAIFPVVPMLLDDDYGLFQSSRLHGIPDVALNLYFEVFRTHLVAVVDIAEHIGGKCDDANFTAAEERECRVTRGPNYDRAANMTCTLGTHTFDLLDDALNAVLSGLEEAPWNVAMPWPRNPRPFGLLAMPLCVATDSVYLVMDALAHVDLFFTLPGNNYMREVLYERPLSRLYNVSAQVQQMGDDLGTDVTSDLACVVARFNDLAVGLFDFLFGLGREVLAVEFDGDDIRAYLSGGTVAAQLLKLRTDADTLGECVERIGDRLGHGLQTVFRGLVRFGALVVKLLSDLVANSQQITTYLGSATFEADVEGLFTALNLVAAGAGGTVRQFGAFGSVECQIRNLSATPDDLSRVETDSMYLNVMCAAGTTLEMYLRFPAAVLRYYVSALVAFMQTFVPTPPANGLAAVLAVSAHFGPQGALDLAREDGVIEHVCLLYDAVAMVPPSLLNLGPYHLQCPGNASVFFDEVLWNILRSLTRIVQIPFSIMNTYIRAVWSIGITAGSGGDLPFGDQCASFLVPFYTATVAPFIEAGLAGAEISRCLLPLPFDAGIDTLIRETGRTFIDTGYELGQVSDCSARTAADGGYILANFCDVAQEIQRLWAFMVDIIEDGIWQAIWNIIVPPLELLLHELIEFFQCIFGNFVGLIDKLGECGGALIDVDEFFDGIDGPENYLDAIEDNCGDWDDVFTQCHFTLEVPTYDIDSVYPDSDGQAGGPGATPLVATDVRGACCSVDVCVGPEPIIDGGTGATPPQTPEQCSQLDPGIGVFVPGQTCFEQTVCNGATTNVSRTGACCFSGAANGVCQEISYEDCIQAANLSGLATGVFIPGEPCSSLNNVCDLRFSPDSLQLGCCVKEIALVDPFQPYIKRDYEAGVSGDECYDAQIDGGSYHAFYVAGDYDCSETQSLAELGSWINGSVSSSLEVQACVPESSMSVNSGSDPAGSALRAQRYEIYTSISSACRVTSVPSLANPMNGIYNIYPLAPPLCTPLSAGRYWCCRDPGDDIVYAVPDGIFNAPIRLSDTVDNNVANYPFADQQIARDQDALDTKIQKILNYFTVTGHSGNWCDQCALTKGCKLACTSGGTLISTLSQAKNQYYPVLRLTPNAVSPTPALGYLDEINGTAIYENFAVPKQVLRVVYLPNGTLDAARYNNLDRDCQVFYYPVDKILPPAARSVPAPTPIGKRSLGAWNPRDTLPRNPYDSNARLPGHPCHRIFTLAAAAGNTSAEAYLIHKELGECMVSDALTHGLGYLLGAQAGERIIHPHYFIDLRVWFFTWYNLSRAVPAAFRHANAVLRAEAGGTETVPRQWSEYAAQHGVTDLLGIRVGHLVAALANQTIGYRRTGRAVPFWLLPFKLSLTSWSHAGGNNTAGNTNSSSAGAASGWRGEAPVFSDSGRQAWRDLWSMNWIEYPDAAFNGTGLLGVREALYPLVDNPAYLLDDGLVLRGLAPRAQTFGRAGRVGGATPCDPRLASCVNCRLVSETSTAIVDHVLNCVEDLQDESRFSADVQQLNFTRTNTFAQPGDPRTCDSARLSEEFTDHDPTGIGAWLVDTLDARDFLGRVFCVLTNTDSADPQSPLFWGEKLIFCNAAIDGSCHRGRAGLGLGPAAFWVTLVFGGVFLVAWLWAPVLPTALLGLTVWLLAVLSVAYFWSPSCIIPSFPVPLPVLPDCLADDLFDGLRSLVEGNCRDYGDIFEGGCRSGGRDFPQCSADPLNFDLTGFRHLFYILDLIPLMTDFLQSTEFVGLSWIREVDATARALDGIGEIRGTPKGDFCFWANLPALLPILLILLGLFVVFLILTTTIAVLLLLLVGFVTLLVHGITALVDILARTNIDRSRFYVLRS